MILMAILFLYLLSMLNVIYYELRVVKNLGKEPDYITSRYIHLELSRKYNDKN